MGRPALAAALFVLTCASPPAAQERAARSPAAGLVAPAARAIALTPESRVQDLLDAWRAASGMRLETGDLDAARLGTTAGLLSAVEVPADRVNAFAQGLLVTHGLELAPLAEGDGYAVVASDPGADHPRAHADTARAHELEDALALRVALRVELPADLRESARWWAHGLPLEAYDEAGGIVLAGRGFEALQLARAIQAAAAYGD